MSTATPTNKNTETLPPAHSLRDAANSDNTLEGYAAMNDVPRDSDIAAEVMEHPYDEHAEISRLAHQYYMERGRQHGAHDDDWYLAERELQSRRQPK